MKKLFYYVGAFCLFTALMASCSSEEDVVGDDTGHLREITMTAPDFVYESGSRTSINIGSNGGSFTWAANDTVGIFPNKGGQVYFPMVSGAGTKTASFTGGGWALKSNATYAAYYPYYIMNNRVSEVPVDFEGQNFNYDEPFANLGKYDYMAAKASTPVNGGVNFAFKHLACVMELSILVPNTSMSLKSVTLTADQAVFTTQGTIDLTDDTPKINPVNTSNSIHIPLQDVYISADNEVIKVYFIMAPALMYGTKLHATIGIDDFQLTLPIDAKYTNKEFVAGKVYPLYVEIPDPRAPYVGTWTGTKTFYNGGSTSFTLILGAEGNVTFYRERDGIDCHDGVWSVSNDQKTIYVSVVELASIDYNSQAIFYGNISGNVITGTGHSNSSNNVGSFESGHCTFTMTKQ